LNFMILLNQNDNTTISPNPQLEEIQYIQWRSYTKDKNKTNNEDMYVQMSLCPM
jgi:hypothetical protein